MSRILILTDNQRISSRLIQDMEKLGHQAIAAELDDVSQVVHTRKPDIMIVDLTFRGGILGAWQQLKTALGGDSPPIIVLVSSDRVVEVELLAGMDDFAVYPCDLPELDARMKLTLSRRETEDTADTIKVGNLVIYSSKYEVTVDGWPVVLTLKEYELLKYLVTHRGRVVTRDALLNQIWGYDYYGGTRTVDVHIGRLRTKIETGEHTFIKTVRGVGYIFADRSVPDQEPEE